MSDLTQHFAAILTRERALADLSVEELGYLSSMDKSAIADLERGQRLPRLDTIVKLAGGLEIEPCELLAGMKYRPGRLAPGTFEVTDEPREAREMTDALIILRRFGDTVKHHRQRLGVSQEEFGFRGNMHRNDAGHFERAERMPMLETILKVAAALEVSPCELLKGMSWKTGRLIPGRFEFEEIKPRPARQRSRQERPAGPVPGWFEIEGRRIPDEEAGS